MNNCFNNNMQNIPCQPNDYQNQLYQQYQQPNQNYNQAYNSYPNNNISNYNRPVMPSVVQNQTSFLQGRMIGNLQDIRPNEIAMDGSPSVFPTNDGNYIYVKSWGADGNIHTIKYIKEPDNAMQKQGPNPFDLIMERLNSIESSLSAIREQPQQKKIYYNKNKEVDNNGSKQ